ncbi:MAG TPA: tRNA lysidine(34) synthetase TilS [Firmicutes bacterium]|nr:tRNA lysidine(34) synthetase TilS [Bacillota bacterium]
MEFLEKVREAIRKHSMLCSGDLVVAAVSGGPDSVALVHSLSTLAPEYGISLYVAHFNHLLRGEEAAEDARFVEDLGRTLGIPVTVGKGDVAGYAAQNGLSVEEAGRVLRYRFLLRVAEGLGAGVIAVGHNADDQAETVLMRILRGAGTAGLAGIPPVRIERIPREEEGHSTAGRHVRIIRPLLYISRREIETYCSELGLLARIDRTNLEEDYLRNRIRLSLIPLLEREYNPGIRGRLARMADILREEDAYLTGVSREWLERIMVSEAAQRIEVSADTLAGLDRGLARRVVREALRRFSPGLRDIEVGHVDEVLELAKRPQSGVGIDLPGGVRAVKEYRSLVLEKASNGAGKAPGTTPRRENEEKAPGIGDGRKEWTLDVPGEVSIPHGPTIKAEELPREGLQEASIETAGKDEAFLDRDLVTPPLTVRSRRPGDRFWPLGLGAPKKLKDFFIDARVPRRARDIIPLVLNGEDIIWVAGYRIDERYKVTERTGRVLHLTLCPEIGNGPGVCYNRCAGMAGP